MELHDHVGHEIETDEILNKFPDIRRDRSKGDPVDGEADLIGKEDHTGSQPLRKETAVRMYDWCSARRLRNNSEVAGPVLEA